jgi:dimethylargininase
MIVALTRPVSASIGRCELTHLEREPIDVARAEAQHRAYEEALRELGCTVVRLPAEPDLPDAVFVEDAAIVLDEVAVLTRPGAASRRAEVASVAAGLGPYRPLVRLEAPATLDGGDVLRVGRTLYVGRSARTSAAGAEQLAARVAPHGYGVVAVPLEGCLHLKSAATLVAPGVLLVQPAWVAADAFDPALERVAVDPAEPFAANALRIGPHVVHPAAFPRTRERLEARGIAVRPVDLSELAKAEGAVTCCSLVLEERPAGA